MMKWMLLFIVPASVSVPANAPIFSMGEAQLGDYIGNLAAQEESFESRLGHVARECLGTLYEDGPLGEGPDGKYDTDPLVTFEKVDCVTYVEQSIAVAASSTYDEMLANLQRVRYKNGIVAYESRNHFMISDWIANNPFCVDVSQELKVQTESHTRTISRKGFFERVEAPELGLQTPDQDVTVHIVPTEAVSQAEKALPSPSLIVFIGNVDWLFSLHCGLYLRDEEGGGKLYHASSKAQAVVGEPLDDYMKKQAGRYIGFTAYKITQPVWAD